MNRADRLAVGGWPLAGEPGNRERPTANRQLFRCILVSTISACACYLAVCHTTPIDRALPFLGVLATVLAAVSYPAVMLAVPMLILAEIAIPDETTRLLLFGAILAIAVAVASCELRASRGVALDRKDSPNPPRATRNSSVLLAIVLILLLRWIPFENVLIGREIVLLAVAVPVVLVLGATPFAVAVAVITALITPAVPLRTLAWPLAVLFVCAGARIFGLPRMELRWVSTITMAFVTIFFSWSGIVARAFPYFLRQVVPERERVTIAQALPPRAEATYSVPRDAHALIISGANVPGLRSGTVLGRMEPGGIVLRIGDAADWGAMRREQFFESRHPLPRDPAGKIHDYGYAAWVDGAGRVTLPSGARTIRLIVDSSLPRDASLQVEGFEIATR